jgi:hypothetical protein
LSLGFFHWPGLKCPTVLMSNALMSILLGALDVPCEPFTVAWGIMIMCIAEIEVEQLFCTPCHKFGTLCLMYYHM